MIQYAPVAYRGSVTNINPSFVPFVMSLISKSRPFPKYFFGEHFRNTPPLTWWKSVPVQESEWPEKNAFIELCEQLHTAVASTAGIERNFSSFGLIQSELRNRLGNQKASKLVFMFKYMNQKIDAKKTNLEWAWEASASTEYHTDVADVINDSSDEDIPLALSMY